MRRTLAILATVIVSVWTLFSFINFAPVQPQVRNYESYSFEVEPAFQGLSFNKPVGIYHANDRTERLFVLEQQGIIYVFDKSDPVATKSVFLDISNQVLYSGELGLLGLAFHPNYSLNGYFYLDYTTTNPRRTIISQFSVDPNNQNIGNVTSEVILLEVIQPYSNHNGGQLAFGPNDGYLYIALGDGGSAGDPSNHGQNRSTLLGSILRIDVNNPQSGLPYGIPADNPFVNNVEGYREEIYAYGLRNPWRFSFDPITGWIWCADVGQNKIEEVDIIEKGHNYGWRIMEGTECYNPSSGCNASGLILPIYEYDHSLGISITGGFVYRGSNLPSLVGWYIYADYGSGRIWALNYNESIADNYLLKDTDLNIVSFGLDQKNELLFCAFDGKIYQLIEIPTSMSSSTSVGQSSTRTTTLTDTTAINSSDSTTLTPTNLTTNSSSTVQDIPAWLSLTILLVMTGLGASKRKKI